MKANDNVQQLAAPLAYIIWEVTPDLPRYGAGVFRTRAEAEAVAGYSMARGDRAPGSLRVQPISLPTRAVV